MTKIINGILLLFSIVFIGLGILGVMPVDENGKRSVISLIAGSVVGGLMGVSIYLWSIKPRAGRIMSVVVAMLGMYQPISNITKGKFSMYPSGILLITSVIAIVALGAGHMMAAKNKEAA